LDLFNGELLKKSRILRKKFVLKVQEWTKFGHFPDFIKYGKLIPITKNNQKEAKLEEIRPLVVFSHLRSILLY
jgi:hypothetical protein